MRTVSDIFLPMPALYFKEDMTELSQCTTATLEQQCQQANTQACNARRVDDVQSFTSTLQLALSATVGTDIKNTHTA
jgi:hypothetical protein